MAAATDRLMKDYSRLPKCMHKNLMVCKACTPSKLTGMTLDTIDGAFHVYCFDTGIMTLEVFCALILSVVPAYYLKINVCKIWQTQDTPMQAEASLKHVMSKEDSVLLQGDGGEPWLICF